MRGDGGWTLFIIIWSIALVGSFIKLFFTGQYNKITTAAYVAMGWLVVFVLGNVIRTMGMAGFAWLLAGGISYTLGVIPYLWEKLPYNHAIWHLFVLGGSVCHFLCILWYVLPVA
jgi:hemolysin III